MNFLYQVILVSLTALILLAVQVQPLQAAGLTQSEDFLARGTTKVLTGDYGGAISDLGQAIQNHPNDAKARMNHGLARAILEDKKGAIGDFNRALQISPKFAEAYYNRGFVRSELQDYEAAITDFEQVLRLNPQDADACHCRGMIRHQLGDHQGANVDLGAAVNLYFTQGRIEDYQGLVNQSKKLRSHNFAVS